MFQNINGSIKVRHGTKKNNISIEKEIIGFHYDLPTIYLLYSNDNHYIFIEKK